MKRTMLYIGLIVAIAIGYYAYSQFNKKVKSVDKMEVDLEVSAAKLLQDFEENEEAANGKYLDKVLLISGKISDIKIEEEKKSIFLNTGNALSNIICQLDDSMIDLPSIGEEVNIKGICTGYLMDVVVIRAIIQ